MFGKRLFVILLLNLFFFTFSVASWAAEESSIPEEASSQLVSQAEDFRKQAERVSPTLEEKPEIISEEEKEAPAEEEGPKFLIKEIRLEGNTLFSEKELDVYISQFENQELTFQRLKQLTKAITHHYRGRGYTTSRAYIPPQKLERNTAVIKIIEGKIGKIIVEGNQHFKDSLYTDAITVRKDRIFRFQDLESSLYFLNQQPDRRAKAYLIAGEEPTTSDIIIKTEETFPVHAYYSFHNRGTKLTHRARHETHLDYNNFTGNGDIFNGTFAMAEEGAFEGGFVNYSYPIIKTGTTLQIGGSWVESLLVKHLKSAEVKGETWTLTPGITQSLVRTPSFSFDGFVGLDVKDSKTSIDDHKSSLDRLRILRAGPRLALQDSQGKTFVSSDVHWGISSLLGGSEEDDISASRLHSGGDFVYYTGSVARAHRLPWSMFAIARANGQWTTETMTALEQFRLGGAYTVRGYPESDSLGDYGYGFSGELNVPVPFLPKDWQVPFSKKKWWDVLRLVAFIDGGKTFLRDKDSQSVDTQKFLLGTGGGVRFDLEKNIALAVDWGFPIGDDSSDEDTQSQIHISLRAGF